MQKFLKSRGIDTAIHYPVPIHLQPAMKKYNFIADNLKETIKQSKEIITLPINQYLKKNEIKKICAEINKFYEKKRK